MPLVGPKVRVQRWIGHPQISLRAGPEQLLRRGIVEGLLHLLHRGQPRTALLLQVVDQQLPGSLVQVAVGGPDLLLLPQVVLEGRRVLPPQFFLPDRVLEGALVLGSLPLQPPAGGGRHGRVPLRQILRAVFGVLVLVLVPQFSDAALVPCLAVVVVQRGVSHQLFPLPEFQGLGGGGRRCFVFCGCFFCVAVAAVLVVYVRVVVFRKQGQRGRRIIPKGSSVGVGLDRMGITIANLIANLITISMISNSMITNSMITNLMITNSNSITITITNSNAG